jgi:hypothetical protein
MIHEIWTAHRFPGQKFKVVFTRLKHRVTRVRKQKACSMGEMEPESVAGPVWLLCDLSSLLETLDSQNPIVRMQFHPWRETRELPGILERWT